VFELQVPQNDRPGDDGGGTAVDVVVDLFEVVFVEITFVTLDTNVGQSNDTGADAPDPLVREPIALSFPVGVV
jgi:hypothetical protein